MVLTLFNSVIKRSFLLYQLLVNCINIRVIRFYVPQRILKGHFSQLANVFNKFRESKLHKNLREDSFCKHESSLKS